MGSPTNPHREQVAERLDDVMDDRRPHPFFLWYRCAHQGATGMRWPLRARALNRYVGWWRRSAGTRVVSATLTIGVLTAAVKLAGAAKIVVVARMFGTADATDAFFVAFLLPSFLAEVIGASFNAALVPTYVHAREHHGCRTAQEFLSVAVGFISALLFSAAVLLFAFRRPLLLLVAPGFSPEKLALARSLLLWMLPLVVLIGVSSVWRAILNTTERFALPAAAPAMTPVLTIALLAAGAARWGASVLAVGALAGTLLEVLIVVAALLRRGISPWPRPLAMRPEMREVSREYVPVLAGAVLTSGALVVDTAIAARLGAGSVSALSYGTKLAAVILAIGPMAVSTAALPHFSVLAASGNLRALGNTVRSYAAFIALATAAVTALLVLYSEPLVRVLFHRGAFTESDVRLVAAVQSLSMLQVPFATLMAFLARVFSSMKANRVVLQGGAITFGGTALFDYLLAARLGVRGIALARAAVCMCACLYLALTLRRFVRRNIAFDDSTSSRGQEGLHAMDYQGTGQGGPRRLSVAD